MPQNPFQYPRSDRRRCNDSRGRFRPCQNRGFQYPRSDRRRCNPGGAGRPERSGRPFQYPRSDRRRCNRLVGVRWTTGKYLSVSSVGSEAMQQPTRCSGWSWREWSFSILGRIGGDATWSGCVNPRTICAFQYPRSDRRRCNHVLPTRAASGCTTFSILGRIGGDATYASQVVTMMMPIIFQYPRSDRRRCNRRVLPDVHLGLRTFSILGRIGGDATTLGAR